MPPVPFTPNSSCSEGLKPTNHNPGMDFCLDRRRFGRSRATHLQRTGQRGGAISCLADHTPFLDLIKLCGSVPNRLKPAMKQMSPLLVLSR